MIQTKYHIGDCHSNILALAIHHGHQMPEAIDKFTGIDASVRLREEDPHTGKIAKAFANNIIVESSRFAIDLNRSAEKAVYLKPEDAWGLPVRNGEVPSKLREDLLQSYEEWYAVLRYQIDRMLAYNPFLVILDIHSYNHHRGGPDAPLDPQIENPDIILGRSNMDVNRYPEVERLRSILDGAEFFGTKLDVRCDVKFTGGNLSRWLHYNYPGQLLSISVEFKKIFMDEWTGRLNPVSLFKLREIFYQAVSTWIKSVT